MPTSDELKLTDSYWKTQVQQLRKKVSEQEGKLTDLTTINEELNQQLRQKYSDRVMRWNHDFWLDVGNAPRLHVPFLDLIDPLYEHLELDGELSQVLFTPLVQRLARVRQLSFSYVDQPMAQHTRMAHSLGTCKNMELAVSGMLTRNNLYRANGLYELSKELSAAETTPEKLLRTAKLLGILHDVGHGPFGHALDRYLGFRLDQDIKLVDKTYSVRYVMEYLAEVIQDAKADPQQIARILSKDKEDLTSFDVLLADLIDSALDVDRLDFLVRDAYATGLQLGFVNSLLIIDLMVPFEDEQGRIFLAFRERPALDFLEHFLYARRLMYSRCYERDSKVSAEGMLILAVQDFLPKSVGQPVVDDLMLLDDELLLDMILASNDPSSKSVQIAKLLKLGRVYSKVYEVHKKDSPRLQDWITNEARKSTSSSQFVIPYVNWRMEIAKGAGLNFEEMGWKILAVPPSPNVYREVDIDINILEEAPGGYGLRPASELSPTLENVQKTVQEAQQVVRVFVHPYLEKETTDRIETSAKKYFTE